MSYSTGIESIQPGANISIDSTDSSHPIISSVGGSGSAVVLETIGAMEGYVGAEQVLFISDPLRGGTFTKSTDINTVDNGLVFAASGGGYWIRQYEKSELLDVSWFGAIGDGVFDNTNILNNLAWYCIQRRLGMRFPNGCFRITNTWFIGFAALNAEDSLHYQAGTYGDAPSFNVQGVINQNSFKPISVVGSANTIIWGDFFTTEAKEIIRYGLWGVNVDRSGEAVRFANLQICSQEGLVYGDPGPQYFKLGHTAYHNPANRQFGVIFERVDGTLTVEAITYHGLEYGTVVNSSYFTYFFNQKWVNCTTGIYNRNSHSITGYKWLGEYCNLAFKISGGASIYSQLNTEVCGVSLNCTNGYNVFQGIYFEDNAGFATADQYQIELGYMIGDPDYTTSCPGVSITGANLAPLNTKAIRLNPGVFNFSLKNSVMSSYHLFLAAGTSVLIENSEVGYIDGTGLAQYIGQEQTVTSGVYAPHLEAQFYLSSATQQGFAFTRIGNIVHVTGEIYATDMDTVNEIGISIILPFPISEYDFMKGVVTVRGSNESGVVSIYPADAQFRAWVYIKTPSGGDKTLMVDFTYKII